MISRRGWYANSWKVDEKNPADIMNDHRAADIARQFYSNLSLIYQNNFFSFFSFNQSRRGTKGVLGGGGGGTMNLPKCSNQSISKRTKNFSPVSHRIRVVSKKSSSPKFSARIIAKIISNLPEFISSGGGGKGPPAPCLLRLCFIKYKRQGRLHLEGRTVHSVQDGEINSFREIEEIWQCKE